MTRQYRYIQWHEKEIKEMPEQGMTYREIGDALRKKGFLHLSVIWDLYGTDIDAYKTSTYPNENFVLENVRSAKYLHEYNKLKYVPNDDLRSFHFVNI